MAGESGINNRSLRATTMEEEIPSVVNMEEINLKISPEIEDLVGGATMAVRAKFVKRSSI